MFDTPLPSVRVDGLYSTSQQGGVGQTVREHVYEGLSRGTPQAGSQRASARASALAGLCVNWRGSVAVTGSKPFDTASPCTCGLVPHKTARE